MRNFNSLINKPQTNTLTLFPDNKVSHITAILSWFVFISSKYYMVVRTNYRLKNNPPYASYNWFCPPKRKSIV